MCGFGGLLCTAVWLKALISLVRAAVRDKALLILHEFLVTYRMMGRESWPGLHNCPQLE